MAGLSGLASHESSLSSVKNLTDFDYAVSVKYNVPMSVFMFMTVLFSNESKSTEKGTKCRLLDPQGTNDTFNSF